ncbi:MAG: cell wall-binding protein [Lachnospiraceae bacterium]|nr:cell wall-binding protein [Lachnospiraceae bacterium]
MKKKIWAVLGLAAALTLGAGFSAWAAEGWVDKNGQWQYQDSYGYVVRNEWKKGADGKWRYLDRSGYIAVNTWVDDEYYVDGSGIMVEDNWLRVDGNADSDSGISWYYFDGRGKAVKDGWKKINGQWYFFDDSGLMQTGWVDENNYYVDENGGMQTGWQKLLPPEDADYTQDEEYEDDPFSMAESDGRYWYYFKPSGKKTTPKDDGAENGVVRIDSEYYCMNLDGALQYGWKNVTGESDITAYKFFKEDGKMATGWYSAIAPRSLEDSDYDVHWYYFNSKGVPKADTDGIPTTKDLITIGNKTYLFNSKGNPAYGLQKVYLNSEGEGEYTSYYFGRNENDCWAKKGRQQVEEDSGEVSTFYFNDSGRGYTGVKDGSYYYAGKLQKAQNDKYEVINLPDKDYGVLVNASGKVMKNTTVKGYDGVKYKTNAAGKVIKIDDEDVTNVDGSDPVEPEWTTEY